MAERWVTGTMPDGRKVEINMERAAAMERVETSAGIYNQIYSGDIGVFRDGKGEVIARCFATVVLEPPEHFLPVPEMQQAALALPESDR